VPPASPRVPKSGSPPRIDIRARLPLKGNAASKIRGKRLKQAMAFSARQAAWLDLMRRGLTHRLMDRTDKLRKLLSGQAYERQ
jgi:hypothetical protein